MVVVEVVRAVVAGFTCRSGGGCGRLESRWSAVLRRREESGGC